MDELDVEKPLIGAEEREMLVKCLVDGSLSQGKYVFRFEKEFAELCGVKYGCAVMNGTAALHLALLALNLKPGDEVLVPSMTFIASANPIVFCGATPVFVDSLKDTWCIDPKDAARKITPKTKGIIAVHLYGNACDMQAIQEIASSNGLWIIEDCAESHGTLYNGKPVGSFSDISFFSFYRNKHITTGEGGMCLTNSAQALERMRLLRSQGKPKTEDLSDDDFVNKQFVSEEVGYNYRMTDLQAAVGLAQMSRLQQFLEIRIRYAKIYFDALGGSNNVVLPWHDGKNVCHTYWGVPVLVNDVKTKVRVITEFRRSGIRLRPFFFPCHMQKIFGDVVDDCPVAEDLNDRGVVLPNAQSLEEKDIQRISETFRQLL